MKVLAFRPRRPSRAEILRLVRDARCGPALAGMTRRAIPAGSRGLCCNFGQRRLVA